MDVSIAGTEGEATAVGKGRGSAAVVVVTAAEPRPASVGVMPVGDGMRIPSGVLGGRGSGTISPWGAPTPPKGDATA